VTYAAGGQAYYSSTVSADGTANRGNGGGGARGQNAGSNGWNGGSGIVILKYPDNYTATFSGGVTQSTTSSGGFKISVVTAAGSDTVSWA
jgi:hypothetical protein